MTNLKLIPLKIYSFLPALIKGDQPITINDETVVEAVMGEKNYYISSETGRFFPQECSTTSQQLNCISNFVLNIYHYGYSTFREIAQDYYATSGKIHLIAKGTVQRNDDEIIFSSNSDGCYSGQNYTIAPTITNNRYVMYDAKCFAAKNISSPILTLIGLDGADGMPASHSLFAALQECNFFYIENRNIGELINHLVGTTSTAMAKVTNYLLPAVLECGLSMVNTVHGSNNCSDFPAIPSNNSLALTDLRRDSNDNNNDVPFAPGLLTLLAIGVGSATVGAAFGYWLRGSKAAPVNTHEGIEVPLAGITETSCASDLESEIV